MNIKSSIQPSIQYAARTVERPTNWNSPEVPNDPVESWDPSSSEGSDELDLLALVPAPGEGLPTVSELPDTRSCPGIPSGNPGKLFGLGMMVTAGATGLTALLTHDLNSALAVGGTLGIGTAFLALVHG